MGRNNFKPAGISKEEWELYIHMYQEDLDSGTISIDELPEIIDEVKDIFDCYDTAQAKGLMYKSNDKGGRRYAEFAYNKFFSSLTAQEAKRVLPHLTTNDVAALDYSAEEIKMLRGSKAEKALAMEAKICRTQKFIGNLKVNDYAKLIQAYVPDVPDQVNEIYAATDYITTNDRLTKAVFGELIGKDKSPISIVNKSSGTFTLWKNKQEKDVSVMVNIDFDSDFLESNGISISGKQSLSKPAREIFGTLLSHAIAGNRIITKGMIGQLIFDREGSKLTEAQNKYIEDGLTEIFSTIIKVDTEITKSVQEKQGIVSLNDEKGIKLKAVEQIFPGRFVSANIRGNLVDAAIELYDLPILYKLQNQIHGSIIRTPVEMLAIPGRSDTDLVTIRSYLIRRIEPMKRQQNKLSRMILYSAIFNEVGIDSTDRKNRNRISATKKRVKRILDFWTEKGYIKGYQELDKNGKLVKGNTAIYEIQILL